MEINENKTDSIRFLGKLDISALQERIASLKEDEWDTPEDFDANYNKNSASVLTSTKHIIFRFSNKQVNPYKYFNGSRWNEWKAILLPLLEKATIPYHYKKGVYTRIMLAKLPAKSFIAPHTDGTSSGSVPHKIHIPIKTNKEAIFYLEGVKNHFKVGEAYEVNNSAKHAVANSGKTDRIHLIFEYLDYTIQPETTQKQLDKL